MKNIEIDATLTRLTFSAEVVGRFVYPSESAGAKDRGGSVGGKIMSPVDVERKKGRSCSVSEKSRREVRRLRK